jgi:hypothetical protein
MPTTTPKTRRSARRPDVQFVPVLRPIGSHPRAGHLWVSHLQVWPSALIVNLYGGKALAWRPSERQHGKPRAPDPADDAPTLPSEWASWRADDDLGGDLGDPAIGWSGADLVTLTFNHAVPTAASSVQLHTRWWDGRLDRLDIDLARRAATNDLMPTSEASPRWAVASAATLPAAATRQPPVHVGFAQGWSHFTIVETLEWFPAHQAALYWSLRPDYLRWCKPVTPLLVEDQHGERLDHLNTTGSCRGHYWLASTWCSPLPANANALLLGTPTAPGQRRHGRLVNHRIRLDLPVTDRG